MMRTRKRWLGTYVSMLAMMNLVSPAFAAPPLAPNDLETVTPIKHVIVIYGENRSFDHLFATYQPINGQHVANLLSEGIVDADGAPGPNVSKVRQWQAIDSVAAKKAERQPLGQPRKASS